MLVCVAALGGEPDFPGPPEATVVWVGRAIEVNGMPTQIRRFETDDRMEKVARFYRREWQYGEDGGQGYVESNAMPPWRLITRVEDGYLMTVQYQKGQRGGAWGYLAMGRLPDPDGKPKVPRAAVPAPGKSQVLNEIASEDPGQTGRSTVLVNEKSLRSNVDFYNSHYPGHGWSTEMDRPVPGLDMHVLAFRKRRERVTITLIGDHKGTRIMHHTVKRDLL
jgi:hypothetical protein